MRYFAASLLTLCAVFTGAVSALAQNSRAPKVERGHYTVTVDNGSGETITKVFDDAEIAKQRAERNRTYQEMGLSPVAPSPIKQQSANAGGGASDGQSPGKKESEKAAPPAVTRDYTIRTEDGRTLPFSGRKSSRTRSGPGQDGTKSVDEDVDPYGGLRNWNKVADELSERRYGTHFWQRNARADLGGENRGAINLGEWHSRFNTWGGRTESSIELKDTLNAERRDMPMVDRKSYEYDRSISPWSSKFAEFRNNLERMENERNNRFLTNRVVSFSDYLQERYKLVNNFSMQDINRYQFRRSHSSEAGLPVTAPGGDVTTNRFKRNN
ncbi:MAG: hypothetical protein LBV54_05355 [Puniceicoccales bacterium]|jgi:hypothetical protein|nr:hypothetical protein [Puniceicoccales bacterium]